MALVNNNHKPRGTFSSNWNSNAKSLQVLLPNTVDWNVFYSQWLTLSQTALTGTNLFFLMLNCLLIVHWEKSSMVNSSVECPRSVTSSSSLIFVGKTYGIPQYSTRISHIFIIKLEKQFTDEQVYFVLFLKNSLWSVLENDMIFSMCYDKLHQSSLLIIFSIPLHKKNCQRHQHHHNMLLAKWIIALCHNHVQVFLLTTYSTWFLPLLLP